MQDKTDPESQNADAGTARPAEAEDATLDVVRRMIEAAAAAPPPEPEPQTPAAPVAEAMEARAQADAEDAPEDTPAGRGPSRAGATPGRIARLLRRAPAPDVADPDPLAPQHWADPVEPDPDTTAALRGWHKRLAGAVAAKLRHFLRRPDAPRWIALALLALAAIFDPWFFVALLVIFGLAAVVAYFTLGPDRVAELVVAWHDRLAQRDPDKAEVIRRRAARVSRVLAALIERLPERWTAGLYLPDFEPAEAMPAKLQDDPFAKLAAEARATERG
jgi:hypothetical protein